MLACRDAGFSRIGLWAKLCWIVVAMVAARSVAMAFNRVLDAEIDARNPRTKSRHLPAGLLSMRFALVNLVADLSLGITSAAAWMRCVAHRC